MHTYEVLRDDKAALLPEVPFVQPYRIAELVKGRLPPTE